MNFSNGTCVSFSITFEEGGKSYQYVAVKIFDKWYTTGNSGPQGCSWEQLILFIRSNMYDNSVPQMRASSIANWEYYNEVPN